MEFEKKVLSREIQQYLYESGLTLGTAESCTGGRIAEAIISVPGASAYFKGGIISYTNDVKENVLAAALPAADTDEALNRIREIFPCFHPAHNVLETSLENIGAVFHPSIILFNAAAIERGEKFYFYRDITQGVVRFIERLDAERLAIGRAYGLTLTSARDWVSMAYDHIMGDTLRERMFNNPAYYDITAPTTLRCRQLLEDIPTGFVPMLEFGRLAGVETPLMESLLPICSTLLDEDFRTTGRTLEKMGLGGMSFETLLNKVR